MKRSALVIGCLALLIGLGAWQISNPSPVSVLYGNCSGTVTSNTTIVLTPFQASSLTCSSTSAFQGIPVGAHIARNLHVFTSTASGTVGSGVVSVFKNGSATAVTCTLSTATSCEDLTNSVAFADGDKLTIKVQSTAASGDTLANVSASVELN